MRRRYVCLVLLTAMLANPTALSHLGASVLAATPASVIGDPGSSEGEAYSSTSFAVSQGTSLVVDGRTFRFVGANMYNAAGDPEIFECGPWMYDPDIELDDWFGRAKRDFGARVIRFWAFQEYTAGGTDWRAFDRVLRTAKRHGLLVIPVLENQWEDCTQGGFKDYGWYDGGYLQPYGQYPLSYKEYVRRVAERYRGDPTVLAWMLVNEPESLASGKGTGSYALYGFARDMSGFLKSVDPNHLVSLGAVRGFDRGVWSPNYEFLHHLPDVDFIDYHDYEANDEPMPGAPDLTPNTLSWVMEVAKRLGKPVVVGEAGMTVTDEHDGTQVETRGSRSRKMDSKIEAFFANGGAGYVVWAWNPDPEGYYDFVTGDPLNPVLLRHSRRLAEPQ